MKRVLVIAAVASLGLAYLAGYWPEHRRVTVAETHVQSLQQRLNAAEARLRVGDVLGRLLRLSDAVAVHNYGQAATLSSGYYDGVRDEASRTDRAEIRDALTRILQTRDQVTAALAHTDPGVMSTLSDQEAVLRRALGYDVDRPNQPAP